jgi:hypothetical protein
VDTFFWDRELSALCDGHLDLRLVSRSFGDILNLLHDLIALKNLTEDNVSSIKMAVLRQLCSDGHAAGTLTQE